MTDVQQRSVNETEKSSWSPLEIITSPEKGYLLLCQNYTSINSYLSKLMLHVSLNRLKSKDTGIITVE